MRFVTAAAVIASLALLFFAAQSATGQRTAAFLADVQRFAEANDY